MTQAFRIENGGLINRSKKLSFKFNGKNLVGSRLNGIIDP